MKLQETAQRVWEMKYRVEGIDKTVDDNFRRVAKYLASQEVDSSKWEELFYKAMLNGAIPGGRIMANAGTEDKKKGASLINCLGGETEVLTSEGIIQVKELLGRKVKVVAVS